MAENNHNTDTEKRVPLSLKLDPAVFGIVSGLATEEDRTLSNMVERLLKTHERIQPLLGDVETVAA